MTNPLIAKYEELYGKKEEPKPQQPPIVEYFDEVGSIPSQEQTDTLNKYLENLNISYVPPQSVATSNTGITAANPYPKFTTYDNESLNNSFVQIAKKVKNKQAQVCTMNMDYEHHTRTQRITFEVLTNF